MALAKSSTRVPLLALFDFEKTLNAARFLWRYSATFRKRRGGEVAICTQQSTDMMTAFMAISSC